MPQKKPQDKKRSAAQNLTIHTPAWENALVRGREEDGYIDWTTIGTMGARANLNVTAEIIAKSDGVWAAQGLIDAMAKVAPQIRVRAMAKDGDRLRPGMVACAWSGPAADVLAFERPFLNLASYVGGIATRTANLVKIVRGACPVKTPRVTSTRKILPGYRDLAIVGVMAGGGHSHRVNLSGGVLIKENHIAAAGGIARAIEGARAVAPHGLKVEIEVTSEKELEQALKCGIDAVLLDNFSPQEIRSALKKIEKNSGLRPVVEVSGGLNDDNIGGFAIEGVDILSVGSLTHSVQATDLSLLIR